MSCETNGLVWMGSSDVLLWAVLWQGLHART